MILYDIRDIVYDIRMRFAAGTAIRNWLLDINSL